MYQPGFAVYIALGITFHRLHLSTATERPIKGPPMNHRQGFLVLTAIGLVPIALGYGVAPQQSLESQFAVSIQNVNGAHIFRAIMGLYLALATFWVIGAFNSHLRQAALYSLVVFMLGLAAGRLLSLVVDGVPNRLLMIYLALELVIGLVGLLLLRRQD
jgi:hypothetical protein